MSSTSTPKYQSDRDGRQEHRIEGREVTIVEKAGRERLQINGRPVKFYRTEAGYLLGTNVYAKPQKTLLDAVKQSLGQQASSSE
jgi:hypothetical protein